ncbi:MAG: hypothetical protein H6838_15270 [Planctomycetes bacterium]|nr:hypothetical protein [Planctomycetota bacterium]MCB9886852.1 hypothetical protein [Planctomycetota bacterium]
MSRPAWLTPVLLTALLLTAACASAGGAPSGQRWPLVYSQDFATAKSRDDFACSDPTQWRWTDAQGRPSLELLGKSDYQPPFRAPTSQAILTRFEVADFDLECDVLQTGREYGHRDLCLFFGWQSAERFYYVHLATAPDPNAHNVFVVDRAARTNLSPVPARGVDWGDGQWHHLRLHRRASTGEIAVYWDRGEAPILVANDGRFDWGHIGLGSFDDSGRFANLRIWAPTTRPRGLGAPAFSMR